jgi:hypothetical protein
MKETRAEFAAMGVRSCDDVRLALDWAIAKQTPANMRFLRGSPCVQHVHKIWREFDRDPLVVVHYALLHFYFATSGTLPFSFAHYNLAGKRCPARIHRALEKYDLCSGSATSALHENVGGSRSSLLVPRAWLGPIGPPLASCFELVVGKLPDERLHTALHKQLFPEAYGSLKCRTVDNLEAKSLEVFDLRVTGGGPFTYFTSCTFERIVRAEASYVSYPS